MRAATPANSGESESSSTSTPQVTQAQTVSSRNLPAFILTSAWERKCCTLVMRGHCCSMRLSAGMSLSSSSRNSSSSSEGWRSLACCTVARRSRSRRACERRSSNSDATANTPAATSTKTTTAISAMIMLLLPAAGAASYLHYGFEHRRAHAAACRRQPVSELGAYAGRAVHALYLATFRHSLALENEDVLHGNDVALHARNLANRGHLAGAVGHARNLHHSVDGGGDLLPHGALGNVEVGHGNHVLDARQRVAWRVGVHRGQRAFVAGVHGLQHVKGFLAADFAHHYAVGSHTQAVDHQLSLADSAFAFDVGWARFQPYHVFLLELQFGRVFNGDDAFRVGNVAGKHVEQRGFAGAGAAGN